MVFRRTASFIFVTLFSFCTALVLLSRPARAAAPNLVWKPYLQQIDSDSAIIVWTTNNGEQPLVEYGTDAAYGSTASGETRTLSTLNTRMHRVRLSDLLPNTTYFYKLFTDGEELLPDETLRFRTAPATGSSVPFTFLAFGDYGTGSSSQRALRDQMLRDSFDFLVTTGDNAYQNGAYNEFDSKVFQVYGEVFARAGVFPALGNHDTYTSNGAPYLDLFDLSTNAWRTADQERYYSFDYGNAHVVVLDSTAPLSEDDATTTDDMFDWLRSDLQQTSQPWKIAVLHHSPYSVGKSHGSDQRARSKLVPIFEQYGVQLVLSGHDHTYQRSKPLLDGQITTTQQGGVVYIVSGAGSAASYGCGNAAWLEVKFCSLNYGMYGRISVAGDVMTIEAVRETGAVLDSVTLAIGDAVPTATSTPTTTSTPTSTPTPTNTPTPVIRTFTPSTDAYVSQASASKNYGSADTLSVDGDPRQEGYLCFALSGLSGRVQQAILRLYATSNGTWNGPAVYATTSDWTEASLTWSTRPGAQGSAVANAGNISTYSWVEYDVTALVSGNGSACFALVADSSDSVVFSSREGSTPPQLVVTY